MSFLKGLPSLSVPMLVSAILDSVRDGQAHRERMYALETGHSLALAEIDARKARELEAIRNARLEFDQRCQLLVKALTITQEDRRQMIRHVHLLDQKIQESSDPTVLEQYLLMQAILARGLHDNAARLAVGPTAFASRLSSIPTHPRSLQ